MTANATAAGSVGAALVAISVAGYPFLVAAGLDHLSARSVRSTRPCARTAVCVADVASHPS